MASPVSLVGRDRELASLISLWRGAGASDVIVVSGEPGVGKTRLVEELAAFVTEEGAVAASARCFAHAGRPALAPVAEWLRSPHIGSASMALEADVRDEVDRLVPSSGAESATSQVRPATQQHEGRFFDGLSKAVSSTGRPTAPRAGRPPVVRLETIAWLAHLLGTSKAARPHGGCDRPTHRPPTRIGELAGALRGLRTAVLVVDLKLRQR